MGARYVVLATDGSVNALKAAAWVDEHLAGCHVRLGLVSVAGVSSFDDARLAHGITFNEDWANSRVLEEAWSHARQRAEQALHQTAQVFQHLTVDSATVLESTGPAAAIVHFARDHHADAIVVGRRGHTSIGALLGSVSFAIVQQSPIPVTIVGSYPIWDDTATHIVKEG